MYPCNSTTMCQNRVFTNIFISFKRKLSHYELTRNRIQQVLCGEFQNDRVQTFCNIKSGQFGCMQKFLKLDITKHTNTFYCLGQHVVRLFGSHTKFKTWYFPSSTVTSFKISPVICDSAIKKGNLFRPFQLAIRHLTPVQRSPFHVLSPSFWRVFHEQHGEVTKHGQDADNLRRHLRWFLYYVSHYMQLNILCRAMLWLQIA